MKYSKGEVPSEIPVEPQHIGTIGEVLFCRMYEVPRPIADILREHISDEVPENVPIEDVNMQVSRYQNSHLFNVNREGDEMSWEPDARITALYHAPFEERETLDERLPSSWRKEFPTEIKTGPSATTRNDQRAVMEYLANHTNRQPVIVRLSIDNIPDSFSVTELEVIGE